MKQFPSRKGGNLTLFYFSIQQNTIGCLSDIGSIRNDRKMEDSDSFDVIVLPAQPVLRQIVLMVDRGRIQILDHVIHGEQ